MALVKFSGLISRISGKLGGSIIAQGANGQYIKQNSFSQQPNTPKQSIQRNLLGIVTQKWRSLSISQRAAWQVETVNYPYVNAVGDTVLYTAYQLFNFINANRQSVSLPITITAPPFLPINDTTAQFFQQTGFNLRMQLSNSVFPLKVKVYVSPPTASPVQQALGRFRLLGVFTTSNANTTYSVTNAYKNVFGNLSDGQYFSFFTQSVNPDSGYTTVKQNPTIYHFAL